MDPTTILELARAGISELAPRATDLIRSLPDATAPIPGSDWTVREVAVHLGIWSNICREMATGTPFPITYESKAQFAEINAALNADIPETDPGKLAALIEDAVGRFLQDTEGRSGDQPVTWHSGLGFDLARILCVGLGELVLHGYDVATATGRPWPIDPVHASLVLYGYGPLLSLCLNPATAAGHTAAYGLELRGGDGLTFRFTDGAFSLEAAGAGPVDCVISADPVAFLLIAAGRMSQWEAIALGLLSAGGDRPELALGFGGLFVYP